MDSVCLCAYMGTRIIISPLFRFHLRTQTIESVQRSGLRTHRRSHSCGLSLFLVFHIDELAGVFPDVSCGSDAPPLTPLSPVFYF